MIYLEDSVGEDYMLGQLIVKQEGMYSSLDNPEIPPWSGHNKEFSTYFCNKYNKWYFKIFITILQKIAIDAWRSALFENAKMKLKPGLPTSLL